MMLRTIIKFICLGVYLLLIIQYHKVLRGYIRYVINKAESMITMLHVRMMSS
ncbi:protein 4 [Cucurbit cytorhabdovirus 1]|uniref:protein 4 n=1 Tax=Cucurbit cytorhabdovirus 1 TaxID=2730538 RepID=UPI002481B089|nr:protein 4 [Cucurbit cytorhabdovirus 1]QLT57527.1 protein 4 [Cucurbit cytorhabdovirus 1]